MNADYSLVLLLYSSITGLAIKKEAQKLKALFYILNDADLLLSLPMKRREIVVAKALSKTLFNAIIAFMFVGPYMLGVVLVEFSLSVIIGGIIVTLLYNL